MSIMSMGPIENAVVANAKKSPKQILADLKNGASDKQMHDAEAAAGRGETAMVANMNVSKSIADVLARAKIPHQTFETDAWYVSNGTAKTKEDEAER